MGTVVASCIIVQYKINIMFIEFGVGIQHYYTLRPAGKCAAAAAN